MEKKEVENKTTEELVDSNSNSDLSVLCDTDDSIVMQETEAPFTDEIGEIDMEFDKEQRSKEKTAFKRNERRCHALFNYFRYLAYGNPNKVELFWESFIKISKSQIEKGGK